MIQKLPLANHRSSPILMPDEAFLARVSNFFCDAFISRCGGLVVDHGPRRQESLIRHFPIMATEIERKFQVTGDLWRDGTPGVRIAQGYLSQDPDRTVRVRIAEERAWLTIKGRCEGITRAEFEYAIPLDEARALLDLCLPSVIDKTRYRIPFCGHLWEIDVFHGDNEGLVIAEVELADASISPTLPPWVGLEVSSDSRYFNSSLAVMPYAQCS
jgi:CYTH domain-containing protein